ncbi:hypothetical protein DH2020_006040 [Rehmannia glutinosa]|uniref:Glutamate receptor n=1 Tax=Rehmannia glutinosa TaxID=99300 RepID=A0ABR0XHV4_REHGL
MAVAQTQPVPIRVGVVLDMDNYLGEMGLNCISMALSDFYATNAQYKTRLQIFNRDSKGDVVGAAAAALDLLKNVEVQAIIGPLSSVQSNFMINLGDKAQVPIITFSATSPSLSSIRSPYFIRAALNDSSQVHAISAIIQAFGWREVVLVYMDNEFGEGIIPFLTDALEQVNARVPYRSVIPSLATDDQIVAELYKMMTMQTRVFIVHMSATLGSRFFTKAKQLGMMSEDYVWIVTDGITNELNSINPSVVESMLGVIGVKPYISKKTELDNFTIRYKKRLQQNNPTALSPDLNIFGLWAYDSAIALAMAAEKAGLTNSRFEKTNISINSTDLEAFGVSITGPELIQGLSSTSFRGLAGDFQLVDGQLQSSPYEIVNVVGPGARVIGYWQKDSGIVKELNLRNENTNKHSNFGSIIWPGDKTSPPKGWVIPTNGKKLRIGVPVKDGFTEFVRFTWNSDNSTQVEGYCIDVFDAVMAALPYGVQYEYIPFATPDHKDAGTHNDLAYQERVISNLARFVLIIWFLVVFILTQSYTASLTSMLTVQQLQPTVTDVNELIRNKEYVGYQEGSFVYGLLKRMNFDESRLLVYNSVEECDELLSKGSGNGGIAAAFDEIPYIKLFLAKYCSKYTMVFPIGSPLVPDVSRAILNITEGEKMVEIEKKWLGDKTKCADHSTNLLSSNSLGLESFWGLFMIVGISAFSAFIIHVIRFLQENWHVLVDFNSESTILSKIKDLIRRFDNRDLRAHTFRKNGGDGESVDRAIESNENHQESPISFSLTSPPTNSPASAIFSDYGDQNVNFRREQGSSVETAVTNHKGKHLRLQRRKLSLLIPIEMRKDTNRYSFSLKCRLAPLILKKSKTALLF